MVFAVHLVTQPNFYCLIIEYFIYGSNNHKREF